MTFRVLGPVEVVVDGRVVPSGHPRQRAVLAVLLVEANRTVLAEQLIDRVWGEQPPNRVRNVLSGYVTRLRAIEGVRIERRSGGYLLAADRAMIDLHRFRDLVGSARCAADDQATVLLSEALDLWRGPAFADATSQWLLNLRDKLDNERMTALLLRNDIGLRNGRHSELLAELHELAAAHPLDERATRQLMLALYRCGRQADALSVYAKARALLTDELGLEPSQDLQSLQCQILDNDAALLVAPPTVHAALVPRQLPAGTTDFIGRDNEIVELDEVGHDTNTVVISAIDGAAGMGKTALAVHWARRAASRFPDGQLFVNLRGFAAGPPMHPLGALTQFLRALGIPPDQVPLDTDEAAGLYRSVLADRRVLVVLDDAYGPEQVRPLLPGNPACTVVITSRNRLGGLVAKDGARRLTLDVLTGPAAVALLTRLLGAKRVCDEPDAVAELAELCAHLPLALRIAAANLANYPYRSIAAHVEELRAGNRLDALQVDGDQEAAVRSAFGLSYDALEPDARSLFRRLGLLPGPDLTAATAAVLITARVEEAARLLDVLAAAHLVESGADGRYRCHDLIRLFAAERAAEDSDGEQVSIRLAEMYLDSTYAAADLLYPQMLRLPRNRAVEQVFADHTEALAWLDAERANLGAVINHSAHNGPRHIAWSLADALRGYFWLRRCAADWLAAAHTALDAAEGDELGKAAAQLSIADVHWSVGRHAEAIEGYRAALRLARSAEWNDGEATVLGNLASVHVERGELDLARTNYLAALTMNPVGSRRAAMLSNLGNLDWEQGALDSAAAHFTEALALHEHGGALVAKANALVNLGTVEHDRGRLDQALDYLTAAVKLCRDVGDGADEATALANTAAVHRDLGRFSDAFDSVRAALVLAREIGGRRIEASALNVLGTICQRLGRHTESVGHHQQALALGRTTADRRAETEALIGIADGLLGLGRLDDALRHADDALAHAQKAGYRLLAGQAWTVLADIRDRSGEHGLARSCAGIAVEVFQETGGRLWLERATGLG